MKPWTVVLFFIVAFNSASIAQGQPAQRIIRVGYLSPDPSAANAPYFKAFREELFKLGWMEGRNLIVELRHGRPEELDRLAAELVQVGSDVLVMDGSEAAKAAMRATSTIPIVLGLSADPVASGLVTSLAKPGGNVTGLSLMLPDLAGKRLELLKEIAPKAKRVAVLVNLANPALKPSVNEAKTAASVLGVELRFFSARSAAELDTALLAVAAWHPQALWMMDDVVFYGSFRKVVKFARIKHLPAIYEDRSYAEAGGLMSYGPSFTAMLRRAAAFVDRILKGAKPSELPVEQPMRFDLVVNETTAKALGLTMPESILIRAELFR